MARPQKTGLDYYNIETDIFRNRKIRRVINNFGAKGWFIYSYLITEIYRDKGCFLEWDENTAFDVSDVTKEKESLINEVVNFCCNVGLFNKELLTSEKVLTAKNIQEFWVSVTKKAKRSVCDVDVRFSLVSNIVEESTLKAEESTLNKEESTLKREESTQSKVKESKVNTLTLYESEKDFLNDWNKAREHYEKKQSNISKLTAYELSDFRSLQKEFSISDFKNGIRGLFSQKNMFSANRLRPTHFLKDRNIEKYMDCQANNTQLFEDQKQKKGLGI